ncbi:MAG: Bifunctional ligase/repressor BirA [candidate division WS2 bacterium]|nr:Bifunctional ligase/repressor BirA [Candidatus Lithacetigena glycinireducens]
MKPYREIGHKIIWLEEVDSTNNYAKNLAEKGEEEGIVVVARKQTCGRGREDRNWISPEGGLYLSFILRPVFPVKELTPITRLSAVAVLEAVEDITSLKCQLKWPNDLLLHGKKVCGILTESKVVGETVVYVVVGIGVNVNNSIEELNAGLQYPAVSLKEKLGYDIEISILLKEIIRNLNKYYPLTLSKGWSFMVKKWKEKLYQVDKELREPIIHLQDFLSLENEEGELA